MKAIHAFVVALESAGLKLFVADGQLAVTPGHLITNEMRPLLARHRSELIEMLLGPQRMLVLNTAQSPEAALDTVFNDPENRAGSALEMAQERAGILEYDGGYSRLKAELAAQILPRSQHWQITRRTGVRFGVICPGGLTLAEIQAVYCDCYCDPVQRPGPND